MPDSTAEPSSPTQPDPAQPMATECFRVAGRVISQSIRPYTLKASGPWGEREVTVKQAVFVVGGRPGADLTLPDPTISGLHLELSIDAHGYRLKDLQSTNGTEIGGYRVRDLYLRPGAKITIGSTEICFTPLQSSHQLPLSEEDRFGPLVGKSAAMRQLFERLSRVAKSDATVLVQGESGTGKELVAEAVHGASERADKPLIVFDCAAVPPDLMESELFGHERGAFTGANERKIGLMEQADGGTLFLDELGELPLSLQPKLLRALEKREVRRVGGKGLIKLDIRVVAATNRDLSADVNRGIFRQDLYYRLAVVRVRMPPLRERSEDIPLLLEHLIRRSLRGDTARARAVIDSISEANRARLCAHPFPGNVRELKNLVERTLALSTPGQPAPMEPETDAGLGVPSARHAAANSAQSAEPEPSAAEPSAAEPTGGSTSSIDLSLPFSEHKKSVVKEFERAYLVGQLKRFDGNFSQAAAASGMDRMYFKRALKKHTR